MTTATLIFLGVLAPVWCLAAGLLIFARRRHYAILHKAMHRNVLALFAHDAKYAKQTSSYDSE